MLVEDLLKSKNLSISLCLFVFLVFSGCNGPDHSIDPPPLGAGEYNEVCFKGIRYIEADRGISVELNREGKVVPCKGNSPPQ